MSGTKKSVVLWTLKMTDLLSRKRLFEKLTNQQTYNILTSCFTIVLKYI